MISTATEIVVLRGGAVYRDPRFAVRPETAFTAILQDPPFFGFGPTAEEAAAELLKKIRTKRGDAK